MFTYELERRFIDINRRSTSIALVHPDRINIRSEGTHFGGIPLGRRDESWPHSKKKPLQFICQMNLTEAPFVPNMLSGIELVTFYADHEGLELGVENGDGWCIRTYASIDDLHPFAVPDSCGLSNTVAMGWHLTDDLPCLDDQSLVVPDGIDRRSDDFIDMVENQWLSFETKVGGYYFPVQNSPWWMSEYDYVCPGSKEAKPEFCIQVSSERAAGLMWGDVGCVYLAKGTGPGHEHRWFLDWACH